MVTQVDLSDELIAELVRRTGAPTADEAVRRAMLRFLAAPGKPPRDQREMLRYFGKVRFIDGYDPKATRTR